jgi:hypothetical protein
MSSIISPVITPVPKTRSSSNLRPPRFASALNKDDNHGRKSFLDVMTISMGSIVIKYTPYTIISDYASYSLSCFTGVTMYFVQAATVTLNTKSIKEIWTVLPHFFIQKFYSSIFEAFTNCNKGSVLRTCFSTAYISGRVL